MYKIPTKTITTIERNESIEGETLEMQIQRMINNGEVLGEEKEMIYTKPSEGVVYGTDIRGDKQEKAIEMTEKVAQYLKQSIGSSTTTILIMEHQALEYGLILHLEVS